MKLLLIGCCAIALLIACETEDSGLNTAVDFRIKKVIFEDTSNEYLYDSIGRLSIIRIQYNNDTMAVNQFHYYNDDNQLYLVETKDAVRELYKHIYTYTDTSVIELIKEKNNDTWVDANKREYVFNQQGQCVIKIDYEQDMQTWSQFYVYTWLSDNIVKEEEKTIAEGVLYTKEFIYNEKDNPFFHLSAYKVTEPEWQSSNNPLSYIKTSAMGDTYNEAVYTYTYNENNLVNSVAFTNEFNETTAYQIEYEQVAAAL